MPSPNGIAVDENRRVIYVAVTRANQVWRGPLQPDGSVTKVGAFQTFYGPSGPDGLALDADGRLLVAHGSLGGAALLGLHGEVTHFIGYTAGSIVTNVAYRPGTSSVVMTESESGTILEATLGAAGRALYSHA